MPDSFPILSLLIFSPLLGVLAICFLPKENGRLIRYVAITATLLSLALSAWIYVSYDHHKSGVQFTEQHRFFKIPLEQIQGSASDADEYFYAFDYSLGTDGLSLPLLFLTALVSAMAALASVHIKKRWKTYYIMFLLLEMGIFGVFAAQDLILFFLFFEATLVPTFFLVGIWGFGQREQAANRFLLYNGVGSAIMLIAFLMLIVTAGFSVITATETSATIGYTGDIAKIAANLADPNAYVNIAELQDKLPLYLSDNMRWVIFFMLIVAFGIKVPIFPFHTWMLQVHKEAPPSVAMIHSGVLLKMGAYGLFRFGILFFPEQAKDFAPTLAILGLVNLLYGAILAFRQSELRLVLAYSSVSQMGIVLLGFAALNVVGIQGAVFQLVSHGLIAALLFLIVGSLIERTKTTELNQLGGLYANLPFISGILLFAGFASLGLPGLSGFVGELLAFLGLFDEWPVYAAVGTVGIVLAAVYTLRAVLNITFGPQKEAHADLKDARLVEAVPMITLVAFILLLGLYPTVLSEPLQHTVKHFDQLISAVASAKMGG